MDRVDTILVKGETLWATRELRLAPGTLIICGGQEIVFDALNIDALAVPMWEDLRVPVNATRAEGSNDPGYEKFSDNGSGSRGVFAYAFTHLVEQELFFDVQIPHGIRDGSVIHPHAHWSPATDASGTVRWGLEYVWQAVDGTFGNTTIITADLAVSNNAKDHKFSEFAAISPPAGRLTSSLLKCRIFRDVTVGGNYGAKAYMHEFDFHYQVARFGTYSEWSS